MVILSVISLFYQAFSTNPYISAVLSGMSAGVGAVIASVVWDMGSGVVKTHDWINMVIMVISFCISYFLNVNVVIIIIAVAVFGLIRTLGNEKGWWKK